MSRKSVEILSEQSEISRRPVGNLFEQSETSRKSVGTVGNQSETSRKSVGDQSGTSRGPVGDQRRARRVWIKEFDNSDKIIAFTGFASEIMKTNGKMKKSKKT